MAVPNVNFWRDRRVLVTGHTGFKGTWATIWLTQLGADVAGISLDPPTSPSLYDLCGAHESVGDFRLDIRERDAILSAFSEIQPEIVLHFAAQPLVRQSYADAPETYETNVLGTVNILEAVKNTSTVQAVICVSSDKCYLNREWDWPYRENDELGGHDPYSSSKACGELVIGAYRDSFLRNADTPVASVRAGNVIGGGDWAADRLVPDLVRAFTEGRTAIIRNPYSIRPWQHVLEPLSGYLILAERLVAGEEHWASAWNFGPEEREARSVEWLANKVAEEWGHGASWKADETESHLHESRTLRLDWSRSQHHLGWRPAWSIETAISRTVAFYRLLAQTSSPQEVLDLMRRDLRSWTLDAQRKAG